MTTGAITGYIDVAQLVLYVFWIFFIGLVIYLRREDKREGYPLVADAGTGTRLAKIGVPAPPDPKTYLLRGGATKTVPSTSNDRPNVALAPSAPWPGAPFVPTGNPFADGVGPGSYAQRADVPELGLDNLPIIAPLRAAKGMFLDPRDPNPVGMSVVGCDGVVGGTVTEVWVDRAEVIALRITGPAKSAFDAPLVKDAAFTKDSKQPRDPQRHKGPVGSTVVWPH